MSRFQISRRDAIKLSTLGLVHASFPAFAARVPKAGLQLYTLRSAMAKDPAGTLARVAEMGFSEVEFAGYHGLSSAETRRALESAGLQAPAAHAGLSDLADEAGRLIDECLEVGHKYLVMAYLQPSERKTLDQYRGYVDLLNRVGERCRESGLELAYHNHDFEFVALEGEIPYDLLLNGTDPKLVKMELDLYWITKAEASPSEYFRRHEGRFPLVHVKDMNAETGAFTELGSGIVDFSQIFADAEIGGFKHYFVEQDVIQGDPWMSLAKSLAHLKQLRF